MPVKQPKPQINWTLIGVVAITAVAIVAIAGMMRPDSLEGKAGKDGSSIKFDKQK